MLRWKCSAKEKFVATKRVVFLSPWAFLPKKRRKRSFFFTSLYVSSYELADVRPGLVEMTHGSFQYILLSPDHVSCSAGLSETLSVLSSQGLCYVLTKHGRKGLSSYFDKSFIIFQILFT